MATDETSGQPPAGAEDELHRKFREALERKTTARHEAHGGVSRDRRGAGPASNDKRQRQFRRKSG